MDLTLALSHADAARFLRLPAVRAIRSGRAHGQAAHIVWHDTIGRTLAEGGLALAEERGAWRLERHRPDPASPWPPARDHLVVVEGTGPQDRPAHVPDVTAPVVAFDGKRTVVPLTCDEEAVTVTLLTGTLRSVVAERQAARITLSGPDRVIPRLVRGVAAVLPLTVPPRSLASEGLCLADGLPFAARRTGAPRLPSDGLSVPEAFSHLLGHLTDVLIGLAGAVCDTGSGDEPVHQMRVAVRRARSVMAIFRPVIQDPDFPTVSAGLKRLGAVLGPARDWDVFTAETAPSVQNAFPADPGLRSLLKAAERKRAGARAALADWLTGAEFRLLCLDLACLTAAVHPVPDATLTAFAAQVLAANWKRLAKSGRSLDSLEAGELHDMRLKAKRLRYAAEFFCPLFDEKQAARFIRRLAELQERLGVFNDTATAGALLRELGGGTGHAGGLVLGFTAARAAGIRPRIAEAWSRLRRRDPFWL